MRSDLDRHRLLNQVCAAHAGLSHPTPDSLAVMAAIAGGMEVLFYHTAPFGGGLTSGLPPIVVGSGGLLRVANPAADELLELLLSVVHEGVHILDVANGVCPSTPTVAAELFLAELRAYTAEHELATANHFPHLVHTEIRGARSLEDISASVQTVLRAPLSPADESQVVAQVGAMFPTVPRKGPP